MATLLSFKRTSVFCILLGSTALCMGACTDSGDATTPSGNDGAVGETPSKDTGATCGAAQTKLVGSDKPISVLAQDETSLFYAVQGVGIFKVAKSGGDPVLIAKTKALFPSRALAADATSLYFDDGEAVFKVAKAPNSEPTMLLDVDTFGGLYLDGTSLIVIDKGPVLSERDTKPAAGKILRIDTAGGTPVELATAQREPGAPVADGDAVYWYDRGAQTADFKSKHDGALMKVAKAGGAAQVVFPEDVTKPGRRGVGAIFLDGSTLYFGSFHVAEKLSESEGGVYRLAKDGTGEPTKVSEEGALSREFGFLEGDDFYMAESVYIAKFPKGGGATTKLTCFKDPSTGSIDLVGDATRLYFIKLASPGSEIGSIAR